MDDWSVRFPTNVEVNQEKSFMKCTHSKLSISNQDISIILVKLAHELTKSTPPSPPIFQISSPVPFTKYTFCQLLSSLHDPPVSIQHLIPVREGPKAGETRRPKDCKLNTEALARFIGLDLENETDWQGAKEKRLEEWWRGWLARETSKT
jgi:hypothetical protein